MQVSAIKINQMRAINLLPSYRLRNPAGCDLMEALRGIEQDILAGSHDRIGSKDALVLRAGHAYEMATRFFKREPDLKPGAAPAALTGPSSCISCCISDKADDNCHSSQNRLMAELLLSSECRNAVPAREMIESGTARDADMTASRMHQLGRASLDLVEELCE